LLDECGKNVCERCVAADHVIDGQWGELILQAVAAVVGRDIIFVKESDWIVVSVDWSGVVAVLIKPRGGVAWWRVLIRVFNRVGCEFGRSAVVEVPGHVEWWEGRDSQNGEERAAR
jgi:hypothetical protein